MAEIIPHTVTLESYEEPGGLLGDIAVATVHLSPPFTESDEASFTEAPLMSRRVNYTIDPLVGSVTAEDVMFGRSAAHPEHTTLSLAGPPSDVQVAAGAVATWWMRRALATRHHEE